MQKVSRFGEETVSKQRIIVKTFKQSFRNLLENDEEIMEITSLK